MRLLSVVCGNMGTRLSNCRTQKRPLLELVGVLKEVADVWEGGLDMVVGPGKYDDLCNQIREEQAADGVFLLIANGEKGSGISCNMLASVARELPPVLRDVASSIEEEIESGAI